MNTNVIIPKRWTDATVEITKYGTMVKANNERGDYRFVGYNWSQGRQLKVITSANCIPTLDCDLMDALEEGVMTEQERAYALAMGTVN